MPNTSAVLAYGRGDALLLNHARPNRGSVPLTKWRVASAAFDTLGSLDLAEALTAALLLDCDTPHR